MTVMLIEVFLWERKVGYFYVISYADSKLVLSAFKVVKFCVVFAIFHYICVVAVVPCTVCCTCSAGVL